jgi:hypothetical protein
VEGPGGASYTSPLASPFASPSASPRATTEPPILPSDLTSVAPSHILIGSPGTPRDRSCRRSSSTPLHRPVWKRNPMGARKLRCLSATVFRLLEAQGRLAAEPRRSVVGLMPPVVGPQRPAVEPPQSRWQQQRWSLRQWSRPPRSLRLPTFARGDARRQRSLVLRALLARAETADRPQASSSKLPLLLKS